MVRVKSLSDPLPLNLDGVPELRVLIKYYGLVLSSKTTNNFYIHFQFMSKITSYNHDDDNNDDDDDDDKDDVGEHMILSVFKVDLFH